MIDCAEAVRRMWSYLDDGLHPRAEGEFEAHLETCKRCCGELEFQHHLRARIARADRSARMPGDVRARIESLLDATEPMTR